MMSSRIDITAEEDREAMAVASTTVAIPPEKPSAVWRYAFTGARPDPCGEADKLLRGGIPTLTRPRT